MKLRIAITLVLSAIFQLGIAQKYTSSKSMVTFYSHAPMEDIRAENTKGSALFVEGSSDVAFVIPIKEFQFQKSLMQEHFNEKYLESDKYPKATFQGSVVGYDSKVTGEQQVKAKGKLTIHGVSKEVEIPGKIIKDNGIITITAAFIVKLADYKVKIPQIVWQNIAEQVEVSINYALTNTQHNP